MAIHSINNFKHLTGQTEAGRRRSPFLTLSYNADKALHDEQRKFTAPTQIANMLMLLFHLRNAGNLCGMIWCA